MAELTQEEKTNGLPTAMPGMVLVDKAHLKALELKAALADAPAATNEHRQHDIKTNVKPWELDLLDAEGWTVLHYEFKGDNLNVVVARPKPVAAAPETEKATIKTVAPTLIIEPPAAAPAAATLTVETVGTKPTGAPPWREPAIDEPVSEPFTPPPVPDDAEDIIPIMPRSEQWKAASNERIFAAGQTVYEAHMEQARARWERHNTPFPFLLTREVNHV